MIDYQKVPEYASVLRKLLKGAMSRDQDLENWERMLRNRSNVESWLEKIGLELYFDESEGYAFLRDPAPPDEYRGPELPRMMKDRSLDYRTTILCVILRQRLLDHDERALETGRPVVLRADLYEEMAAILRGNSDGHKFRTDVDRSINNVVAMKLLKEHKDQVDAFFIERIIKARISADALENIKVSLVEQLDSKATKDGEVDEFTV